MLTQIQIRNYAIVDYLNLEFGPNMTVLTGETGAGKSILVDALGLALGDRADISTVRHGTERAEVNAVFTLTDQPMARAYLTDHALDEDDKGEPDKECLLRRVVGKDGRSRAFINGRAVPLQALRELGGLLVDIHGQHAHQSLLVRDAQRQILDDYAGNGALLATVAEGYRHLHQLTTEYARLRQVATNRENRLDYLHFQLQELDTLALQDGELEILEEEHRWLVHATRLLEGGQAALARLQGDGTPSALALLARAHNELRHLQGVDARLVPATELLESAVIQVEEAAAGLRHYLSNLDLNPQRLNFVEERLATVTEIARKHRVEPGELSVFTTRLRGEVAELEQSEVRAEALATAVATARHAYREAAIILHAARAQVGTELAAQVTVNLHSLGIPGGRFEVACTLIEDQAGLYGADRVEFLVSTNPGSPVRPLIKVVSGGELSRISLALQVLVATNLRVPTLIFDEVDVGIGGRVAGIVGQLLQRLGEQRQVLCVTHLPQVAVAGHHHLLVTKQTDGITTRTGIHALEQHERIPEIARMLGGLDLTDQTRAHAQEMLNLAQHA